jgi:hypothetical protein
MEVQLTNLGGLYGAVAQTDREDYARLAGVELSVPTDEQIARMREDNPSIPVHVSLKITWVPLSYRIMRGSEVQEEETDYIRITKGSGLSGDDGPGSEFESQTVENVRQVGWAAIPAAALISVPKGKNTKRPFERWMKRAQEAGVHLDIDPSSGQLVSNDLGQVFKLTAGMDTFPTWDPDKGQRGGWTNPDNGENGIDRYMRYPVTKAPAYVAPEADQLPVVHREPRAQEAATTAGGASGPSNDMLAAVVEGLELADMGLEVLNSSKMVGITSKAIAQFPVLASGEVAQAVADNRFGDYLAERGLL